MRGNSGLSLNVPIRTEWGIPADLWLGVPTNPSPVRDTNFKGGTHVYGITCLMETRRFCLIRRSDSFGRILSNMRLPKHSPGPTGCQRPHNERVYGKIDEQGAQGERRGPEMEQVRDPITGSPDQAAQTNNRLNFLKSLYRVRL